MFFEEGIVKLIPIENIHNSITVSINRIEPRSGLLKTFVDTDFLQNNIAIQPRNKNSTISVTPLALKGKNPFPVSCDNSHPGLNR